MVEARIKRKLTAILAADVVGYSRMMASDEVGTLDALKHHRQFVFNPAVARYDGRIIKLIGDGTLVEFSSIVDAVNCALSVQRAAVSTEAVSGIRLRIGVNLGDVIIDGDDIYGDGVNVAARLEQLAVPGGICIASIVNESVHNRIDVKFEDGGEVQVKNIERPVRIWRWYPTNSGEAAPAFAFSATDARYVLPSLAVLPFQNMSGDAEQDYFADGVVDDIITALSRFTSFAVIARNSSFVYKGRAVDVRQVAKDLGVRYVLEGSLRRAGDRLRITVQLVDGGTRALWAEQFDGTIADVFNFQDRITERVAVEVEPHIQSAEIVRSRMERPGSIAAYDIYLRAAAKNVTNPSENAEAYTLVSAGLAVDPNDALLLAHGAWVLSRRSVLGWSPIGPDDVQLCVELARRGLRHAAGNTAVMAKCASVLLNTAKEYDLALSVLRSAAETNRNHLVVATLAGVAELHCGRVEDALDHFHRALRLSPRDPFAYVALTGIAHAQIVLGDHPEAIIWATRSLGLEPTFDPTLWVLVAANAHLGRMEEAQHFLDDLRKIAPAVTIAKIKAGQAAKDPSRLAAVLEGLRLAGLPED